MNQEGAGKVDLRAIQAAMLDGLDARSKDVITRRFGLQADEKETLEKIGKEYGITRERVRQIEANAKKALTALDHIWNNASMAILGVFKTHGGVMSEDYAAEAVQSLVDPNASKNTVVFFLVLLPGFKESTSGKQLALHWRHDEAVHKHAELTVETATDILKKKGHPTPAEDLFAEIRTTLGDSEEQLPDQVIIAALTASSTVDSTVFGEWGLVTWPETRPRGVADKAYAVLRRFGKPCHFREITTLINDAHFDHKTANAQTVHNELIKDSRFVLVGRGLYGLKEWGFMSGTVADVLESILKDASKPLTSDELIQKVLEQRIVKKNTILLSLQNGKRFHKTEHGYTLA